jgi:hypothetical protein
VRLGSIRDNILLRLELVLLYIVILILLIFTTARHVDVIELSDIELYPFYYLLVQSMTTWVAIPLIVFMVMLSSRSSYRLVAVLSLAFIIEFLPSFMMVNPWLPDQYPYLSEAYWIYLHGKISDVHRLSTVPGLGLLYGIFEIIINLELIKDEGINSIDLIKIDIEGAELDIITEDLEWLNRIKALVIELHPQVYDVKGVMKSYKTCLSIWSKQSIM